MGERVENTLAEILERNIPEKLTTIISELENKLIEREELIRLILLCVFAKNHVFLIGEAGVAKTYAIMTILKAFTDGKVWEKLFNKETTVQEVIGDGTTLEGVTIAETHFAFFDEMFKADEKVLNGLLGILNERVLAVNGKSIKIPLSTVFSASNEFPQGTAIEPFVDRLLAWYEVKTIEKEENKKKFQREDFDRSGHLSTHFEMKDIEIVESIANAQKLPQIYSDLFIDIKNAMKRLGLKCSDRKFGGAFIIKALKVSAVLNQREYVDYSDFVLIRHFGWDNYRSRRVLLSLLNNVIYGDKTAIKNRLLEIVRDIQRISGKFQERMYLFLRYKEYVSKPSDFEDNVRFCQEFVGNLETIERGFIEIQDLQRRDALIDQQCDENIFIVEKLQNPFLLQDIDKLMNDIESDFMINKNPVRKFLDQTPNISAYQTLQNRVERGEEI